MNLKDRAALIGVNISLRLCKPVDGLLPLYQVGHGDVVKQALHVFEPQAGPIAGFNIRTEIGAPMGHIREVGVYCNTPAESGPATWAVESYVINLRGAQARSGILVEFNAAPSLGVIKTAIQDRDVDLLPGFIRRVFMPVPESPPHVIHVSYPLTYAGNKTEKARRRHIQSRLPGRKGKGI